MRDGGIRLRTTKTASGATAVQAIRYIHRRVVVVKHFGSARTAKELQVLLRDAEAWLAKQRGQPQLKIAWNPSLSASVVDLDRLALSETRHLFAHKALMHVLTVLGFTPLLNRVITNLVIMRICQLAFEQMTSPAITPYNLKPGSKYQGQMLPEESRLSADPEFRKSE